MKEIEIVITGVTEKPDENKHWSYPITEVSYLIEQIKDGDRENGCEFFLYNGRLYEKEVTEIGL